MIDAKTKEGIYFECLTKEMNGRDMMSPAVAAYCRPEQTKAAHLAMDEYAKQQAIKFAEFLHPTEDHNWQMYDGHDRWINLRNNEVKTTEQLFQLFEKEHIKKATE